MGKTGVALRYHSPKDYAKLTTEQRDELREHRRKQEGGARKAAPAGSGAGAAGAQASGAASGASAADAMEVDSGEEARKAKNAELQEALAQTRAKVDTHESVASLLRLASLDAEHAAKPVKMAPVSLVL